MKNCLVTKLKASTGNTNLLRAGEMRIGITRVDSPNDKTQSMGFYFNQPVDLEIIGDGYFTDSTLSNNLGKSLKASEGNNTIYLSNGNYSLSIRDKYSITLLRSSKADSFLNTNKVINIEDLKYCYNLTDLVIRGNLKGDISALSGLTSLRYLIINDNNLTGDISALSRLKSLIGVIISNNNLTGDISALSGLTSLETLSMGNNNLTGNISALSRLTSLSSLRIDNKNVTGDVSSLNTLTNLSSLSLKNMTISGDISGIAPKLNLLSNANGVSNCTWGNRPTTSSIFAIEGGVKVDNIDTMLNNLANCVVVSHPSDSYFSIISIRGSRTSASDEAVSTLQSKGYTVSITA